MNLSRSAQVDLVLLAPSTAPEEPVASWRKGLPPRAVFCLRNHMPSPAFLVCGNLHHKTIWGADEHEGSLPDKSSRISRSGSERIWRDDPSPIRGLS